MLDVAYGDGGITERADGRLQVAVMIDGTRTYRFVPARLVRQNRRAAERMAEALQRELHAQRDAGQSASTQTLAAFLRSWIGSLRDAKRKRIRARTLEGYAMIVETHIIPVLGKRRLDRLNERHVQAWVDGQDAAPRTIDHRRAVLRRALNTALRQRLVYRNVAQMIELPEPDRFRGSPLTFDEIARLFALDDPLEPLWRLAIDAGSRQAELLGLSWDDLDLDAGKVTIRSQLQRRGGQWLRTPPKADRDTMTVTLDRDTVEALRAHRTRQAALRTPDWRYPGLVFTTPDGEPWYGWTILRAFHDALDRAGLPRRRFHDLRATSATTLRQLGVAEDVRMARMGHNTTAMARHYGQAQEGFDRAAATALGDAIRKAK